MRRPEGPRPEGPAPQGPRPEGPAPQGPAPQARALRLYGSPSDRPALPWAWVERQLTEAGTYWVVACAQGRPHPRPVWGVWHGRALHLSVGSPALRRAVDAQAVDAESTGAGATQPSADLVVHLDSGTEVVLVEGRISRGVPTPLEVLAAYDAKYDWAYQVDRYGELLVVRPVKVLAWRTSGPAGRNSFQETGCWLFPS